MTGIYFVHVSGQVTIFHTKIVFEHAANVARVYAMPSTKSHMPCREGCNVCKMSGGNRHITYSGFSKAEVYQALDGALKARSYEQTCYYAVELACTPGEVRSLTVFLVDVYAKSLVSSDVGLLEGVLEYVLLLNGFNKRGIAANPSFQKVLCEFVMLIAIGHRTDRTLFRSPAECTYKVAVEPLLLRCKEWVSAPEHEQLFAGRVSNELQRLLCLLFYLLKKKDLKCILQLCSYLLTSHDYFIDELTFPEVKEVPKSYRKDIVWYLWKVLVVHAERLNSVNKAYHDLYSYVLSAARLFALTFAKKTRLHRVNLLLHCFVVLCNERVKRRPLQREVLAHASGQIHVVFEETLSGQQLPDEGYDHGQQLMLTHNPGEDAAWGGEQHAPPAWQFADTAAPTAAAVVPQEHRVKRGRRQRTTQQQAPTAPTKRRQAAPLRQRKLSEVCTAAGSGTGEQQHVTSSSAQEKEMQQQQKLDYLQYYTRFEGTPRALSLYARPNTQPTTTSATNACKEINL